SPSRAPSGCGLLRAAGRDQGTAAPRAAGRKRDSISEGDAKHFLRAHEAAGRDRDEGQPLPVFLSPCSPLSPVGTKNEVRCARITPTGKASSRGISPPSTDRSIPTPRRSRAPYLVDRAI